MRHCHANWAFGMGFQQGYAFSQGKLRYQSFSHMCIFMSGKFIRPH